MYFTPTSAKDKIILFLIDKYFRNDAVLVKIYTNKQFKTNYIYVFNKISMNLTNE